MKKDSKIEFLSSFKKCLFKLHLNEFRLLVCLSVLRVLLKSWTNVR